VRSNQCAREALEIALEGLALSDVPVEAAFIVARVEGDGYECVARNYGSNASLSALAVLALARSLISSIECPPEGLELRDNAIASLTDFIRDPLGIRPPVRLPLG